MSAAPFVISTYLCWLIMRMAIGERPEKLLFTNEESYPSLWIRILINSRKLPKFPEKLGNVP